MSYHTAMLAPSTRFETVAPGFAALTVISALPAEVATAVGVGVVAGVAVGARVGVAVGEARGGEGDGVTGADDGDGDDEATGVGVWAGVDEAVAGAVDGVGVGIVLDVGEGGLAAVGVALEITGDAEGEPDKVGVGDDEAPGRDVAAGIPVGAGALPSPPEQPGTSATSAAANMKSRVLFIACLSPRARGASHSHPLPNSSFRTAS